MEKLKLKRIMLVVMGSLILLINNVNAECDDKTRLEINTAASNVTADLEMVKKVIDLEGNVHPEIDEQMVHITGSGYTEGMFAYINIANVNDKIFVTLNSDDDPVREVVDNQKALDGKWQHAVPDVDMIRSYTIKVYSDVDGCKDEEIRTINLKTPMYNFYSGSRFCENNDAYYCQEYITTPIDMDVVNLMWEKENEQKNNEESTTQENNNTKMILTYVGIGLVIILVIGIFFIIIRRLIIKHKDKKYMEMGI